MQSGVCAPPTHRPRVSSAEALNVDWSSSATIVRDQQVSFCGTVTTVLPAYSQRCCTMAKR